MDTAAAAPGDSDTIAAAATAPGEAAIAMVRLSGPHALAISSRFLAGAAGRSLPRFEPRRAHLCEILDDIGAPVDQAIVTWYPGPASYTGEDIVEISVHGGTMASRTVLQQCLRHGARTARPGEFTLRAFLAGRIDLSQAEAVIDTVQAQTRAGLKLAHRQLTGALSRRVQQVRASAMKALAEVEAAVDFPDDVDEPDRSTLAGELEEAGRQAAALSREAQAGKIYRDGIRLVIMGRPNVGKSSLLNALLREDRAIVTEIPGTTRDVIEEAMQIGGVPIRAIDTAGLRQSTDPVERLGVERALGVIRASDLCLLVLDRSAPLQEDDWKAVEAAAGQKSLLILNKSDLPAAWESDVRDGGLMLDGHRAASWTGAPVVVEAAAALGEGIDLVENAILEVIFGGEVIPADQLDSGGVRHGAALEAAAASLFHARDTAAAGAPIDLVSVDIRGALQSLGEITGETASDTLLHEIFSRFCIGK